MDHKTRLWTITDFHFTRRRITSADSTLEARTPHGLYFICRTYQGYECYFRKRGEEGAGFLGTMDTEQKAQDAAAAHCQWHVKRNARRLGEAV